MTLVPSHRPIARDQLPTSGWPVAVARQEAFEPKRPCERQTPVTHSHAVLTFFTGGRARMEQNGRWELAAGDVLLIPAGQPHRRLEAQAPQFWGLSFCVPCFAADGGALLLAPFEKVRDGAAAVVHIPASRHAFLEGLFRELAELRDSPSRSAEAQLAVQRSLLTLIMNEVDRATSATLAHALTAPTSGGVVVDSLRYIERNCLRKLTLHDVAAAVGRSPAYVTSALSRATGRSAVDWIVTGRMAEARRLLVHSDERVDIIAERVGYADATHFIRMFRREHGATPAAWRASRPR